MFGRLFLLISLLVYGGAAAAADLTLNPRYDLVNGEEEILINRGMLKATFAAEISPIKFYFDGFAEYDAADESQTQWRRAEGAKGYIQELYAEAQFGDSFFKAGKQALRWSDSWLIPSLDVWTGRRFNRLFIDPLAEQLSHPIGASFSYVRPLWSLEIAMMTRKGKDYFPEPFPETVDLEDEDPISPGARIKWDYKGFQSSLIAARAEQRNTFGYGFNYAFDTFVPKGEIGIVHNDQKNEFYLNRELYFGSLGADIFWGNLVLTPQITFFQGDDPLVENPDTEGIWYLAGTWTQDVHTIEFQGYSNTVYDDSFWSLLYNFTLRNAWGFGVYFQNYEGDGFNLPSLVKQHTGGKLLGVRFQYNGSITF